MTLQQTAALQLLTQFQIETPSWGYADTGTRFGKFTQLGAATTIWEKMDDAAMVHSLTGGASKICTHVLWDFTESTPAHTVLKYAESKGIGMGAINPNLFQDQQYKFGSACSPLLAARIAADSHISDSMKLADELEAKHVSLWFADGTNYPGQDNIVGRKMLMQAALKRWHDQTPDGTTLLIEYKPFEPAFYHTDIADWGMALAFAKHAGPKAKVLVDTGHHLPGANIEHIVAFLLDEGMLGGFHFNDRKYADDDLTLGSIDPYGVFRIFHEILNAVHEGRAAIEDISFAVDQCHNLKPKVEAMVQTVVTAQELFLKAALVDRTELRDAQANMDIVRAEQLLKTAFFADVSGILAEFRATKNLPADPLQELRQSGYLNKIESERGPAKAYQASGGSFA